MCTELEIEILEIESNLIFGIHDVRRPRLIPRKNVGVRALMRMMKDCEMVVWLLPDIQQ